MTQERVKDSQDTSLGAILAPSRHVWFGVLAATRTDLSEVPALGTDILHRVESNLRAGMPFGSRKPDDASAMDATSFAARTVKETQCTRFSSAPNYCPRVAPQKCLVQVLFWTLRAQCIPMTGRQIPRRVLRRLSGQYNPIDQSRLDFRP